MAEVAENETLPPGWTRDCESGVDRTEVVYRYETDSQTKFVVSVRHDESAYTLHLSTIDPSSTHIRHDYPVTTYDTVEAARSGAESFLTMVTEEVQEGRISAVDPGIDEIRRTIDEFNGEWSLGIGELIRQKFTWL